MLFPKLAQGAYPRVRLHVGGKQWEGGGRSYPSATAFFVRR